MRWTHLLAFGLVGLAACEGGVDLRVPPPENLTYELEVSGFPDEPAGILLRWDPVTHPDLQVYRVYSRRDVGNVFALRASTTSTTFHDRGAPDLEYYVVSVDLEDREGEPSESVIVDERLRLEAPSWIASTSLDGAIYVAWADNAFATAPDGFKRYHVYSAPYSLDDRLCDEAWAREGTTVAPEFLVGALANGSPRCFGVSAESIEGFESLWSPIRADTPRPDARNVLVAAFDFDQTVSGFRFFKDSNGNGQAEAPELGIVRDGSGSDIDFRVERDPNGDFFLVPVRSGTEVAQYGTGPIADLTSIDIAPTAGYSPLAVQAVPQFGYVFQMTAGDPYLRFGAIRVTHVGRDYLIFDWSYQTDPGNPELSVGAGIKTAGGSGKIVNR
jgi:hypothetical protein